MDVQQQASSSGHAPYFEMMSDKCKSPTAALTCPDAPKDHSVLPEVLKSDEYSDTAASPVPEASAVPHAESEEALQEENKEHRVELERENSSMPSKASSAYSIVDILNASSTNPIKEKDQEDSDKSDDCKDLSSTIQPPTEQQLKSNLPETHPLKTTVKTNIVIETPKPADFDMYHRKGKACERGEADRENSLLHKNLTEFNQKEIDTNEKPKDLFSPSAEQYNAWLKQFAKKTPDEPEAKRQKMEQQLSPATANSYYQGQAAASLWYQNMAAAAAAASPYPAYPGAFTDPAAGMGIYPGFTIPGQAIKEAGKNKSDLMTQKDHGKLFHCRKCPSNFLSAEKLLRHELTHPYPRPYDCGVFLDRKTKDTNTHTCLLCSEKFSNQIQLHMHVAQVHRKQSMMASQSPTALKEEIQSFRCSFCPLPAFLPSRAELIEHEKEHLRTKPKELSIQCPKCPEVFPDAIACKEHERKHHPTMPRVSQAEFPEPEIRGTMLQECLLNPELEQGDNVLGNNNNSLENNGNLEFECSLCNKPFMSAKLLKSHVKFTHLEERPYTCTICSKSFKQKATLKQHEKLHSDEKPYVCNICSRGFVYPSRLKTHSQTCKGEPVMSP